MILKNAIFAQSSIPVVAKSLDATALRAKSIANNLANLNTPGYRRIEVRFEEELKTALDNSKLKGKETQKGHMALGRPNPEDVMPRAYRSKDSILPGEINNVDVDLEAAKLAENRILFDYGVRFIQDRKSAIEGAIKSGQS